MFTGTTPNEVRLMLQDLMTGIKAKDVFIGCSGNYSVDKIMSKMGYRVHSNDVSLYSKLISDILLGTDTPVKVRNQDLIPVFASWPETKYKKLIQVMFAVRVSKYAPQKNDFQRMFYSAYLRESGFYYESTVAKLEKGAFDFQIHSFSFCDFIEFLKNKKGTGVGISFPPTYKAGYEKIFEYVEESFEYERASYQLFDPKNAGAIFKDLLETDENVFYSDRKWPDLTEYLVGMVNLGQGKHDVFIYSSLKKRQNYYFEKDAKPVHSSISIMPKDYQFTKQSVITLKLCSVDEINYFKAFYMADKVNYTTGGDYGMVFYADGKAFGFASFSVRLSTLEQMFVQSDFVVKSDTDKLSKLLIMLLRSNEVRHLLARKAGNYYEGLKTTVYTDKPVSMKYRGVFDLDRRDKGKLMYTCRFNELTLTENYKQWLERKTK
jgi:hypothetical protein